MTAACLSAFSDLLAQWMASCKAKKDAEHAAAERSTGTGILLCLTLKVACLTEDINHDFAGAVICRPPSFQWESACNQFLVGLAVRGPLIHYWYKVLDRAFASWDQTRLSTAVVKGKERSTRIVVECMCSRSCARFISSGGRSSAVFSGIQPGVLLRDRVSRRTTDRENAGKDQARLWQAHAHELQR